MSTGDGIQHPPEHRSGSRIGGFLRLWFVMFLSFLAARFIFDLVVLNWIDIRPVAFQQLLVLPLAQALVFWIITRRRRGAPSA